MFCLERIKKSTGELVWAIALYDKNTFDGIWEHDYQYESEKENRLDALFEMACKAADEE